MGWIYLAYLLGIFFRWWCFLSFSLFPFTSIVAVASPPTCFQNLDIQYFHSSFCFLFSGTCVFRRKLLHQRFLKITPKSIQISPSREDLRSFFLCSISSGFSCLLLRGKTAIFFLITDYHLTLLWWLLLNSVYCDNRRRYGLYKCEYGTRETGKLGRNWLCVCQYLFYLSFFLDSFIFVFHTFSR